MTLFGTVALGCPQAVQCFSRTLCGVPYCHMCASCEGEEGKLPPSPPAVVLDATREGWGGQCKRNMSQVPPPAFFWQEHSYHNAHLAFIHLLSLTYLPRLNSREQSHILGLAHVQNITTNGVILLIILTVPRRWRQPFRKGADEAGESLLTVISACGIVGTGRLNCWSKNCPILSGIRV